MYNNEQENSENKDQYGVVRFRPEKAGAKIEYYSIYSKFLIALLIAFLPKLVDLQNYSAFLYNLDIRYYQAVGAILFFFGIVKYIKLRIKLNHTLYTLTDLRLTIETGFLSQHISNTELWKIVDTELKQSINQKVMGSCTIKLITQDLSDSIIYIDDITIQTGRELFNMLNDYVHNSVRRSGVMRNV